MQGQSLIRVNGIDGAKAYQMGANSQVALFDANEDIFYVKVTDGAGFPSIRTFRFEEVSQNVSRETLSNNDYVSRAEFEELKEMINNGKFNIQQKSAGKTTATNKQSADADS